MTYKILLLCMMGSLSAHAAPLSVNKPEARLIQLPVQWSITPLMAPTQTMGLRVSSFIIHESEQSVRFWRDKQMAGCRLPAVSEEDDDWHCFDEQYIYSLLWREEGFIWVLSERLQPAGPGAMKDLQGIVPADLNAQILSHSETAFESVTLLHSRRSLYSLQRDLVRLYSTRGARLIEQEQDSGGFVQQWQYAEHRVTYTAQKDKQGEVLLVKVRGTTL